MRAPSTKALLRVFRDLTPEKAALIRKIAAAASPGGKLSQVIDECCPKTAAYVRSLHSSPYESKMWRRTVALHAINDLVEGHGVDTLGDGEPPSYAPPYEYINMGDPYVPTLLFKRATDNLYIGNWGSIVERGAERRPQGRYVR